MATQAIGAAKPLLRRVVDRLYGDRAQIYLRAVQDRYARLPQALRDEVDTLGQYDDQILKLHVGSSAKAQNLLKVKMRLVLTRRFLFDSIGTDLSDATAVDVGAASGVFLLMLGKSGTAVEAWQPAVEFMSQAGIEAVRSDGQLLPFPDDHFDYAIALETLEHVPNPLGMLREISRVARVGTLVSIPYREQTQIVAPKSTGTIADQHIFEMSRVDFGRLANHCGLVVKAELAIALEDAGGGSEYFIRRRSGYHRPNVLLAYLEQRA